MKNSIFAKLIFVLLIFSSQNLFACSVVGKKTSLHKQVTSAFGASEVVAFVHDDQVEKREGKFKEFNTHFRVLESFKGKGVKFSTGWLPECCTCEMHFKEKSVYIIYASQNKDETWFIGGFGPSKELSYVSPKELKYLRKLKDKDLKESEKSKSLQVRP